MQQPTTARVYISAQIWLHVQPAVWLSRRRWAPGFMLVGEGCKHLGSVKWCHNLPPGLAGPCGACRAPDNMASKPPAGWLHDLCLPLALALYGRAWCLANASSSSLGWREPSPPANVPAPQGLPPRTCSLLNSSGPCPWRAGSLGSLSPLLALGCRRTGHGHQADSAVEAAQDMEQLSGTSGGPS